MNTNAVRFVITGATGNLGTDVVESLLGIVPASSIRVSVRRPIAAADFAARGVDVRHGDFDEPRSLEHAFDGAERVLLISTRTPGNRARFHEQKHAIDAARRAGVKHVVYTSVLQRRDSPFLAADGHLDTEDYLAASGLGFSIVRNGHYTENLPMFFAGAIESGVLKLPPDGPTSWVARAEIAEGIARLLSQPAPASQSVALTGPEALDFEQVAALVGRVMKRRIERRVVTPDVYVQNLVSHGTPPMLAELLASGFASRARGELGLVDPTLEKLLGRARSRVEANIARLFSPSPRRESTGISP